MRPGLDRLRVIIAISTCVLIASSFPWVIGQPAFTVAASMPSRTINPLLEGPINITFQISGVGSFREGFIKVESDSMNLVAWSLRVHGYYIAEYSKLVQFYDSTQINYNYSTTVGPSSDKGFVGELAFPGPVPNATNGYHDFSRIVLLGSVTLDPSGMRAGSYTIKVSFTVESQDRIYIFDDSLGYKVLDIWEGYPVLSGIIVTVIGGVIGGAILYFLFYRRKKDSSITIQEVQAGGTVVQHLYVGYHSDPKSSKKIVDGIPDQLSVGERRAKPESHRRQAKDDQRVLIERVARNALGSGPLTPIVADSLKITRTQKKDEETRWLERELYGYEKGPTDQPNTFPDYRRLSVEIPMRVSGITRSGEISEDFNIRRTLFVSFPVRRIEDTVHGARSRGAIELVFWITTPKDLSDLAKEQNAQISSESPGKTPCVVQINDLERLLSELRLRIHRFVMGLQR